MENLNRMSSRENKKNTSETVYEELADYFFDKINFISFPFTRVTNLDTGYLSTTDFGGASRLTDTAEGKSLSVGRESRTRCQFYVKNPDQILGYILSPVVYDSFASLNTFASMDIFRAYVGIKINQGVVTVVVKDAGKTEIEYPTALRLSGSGESKTYLLEMRNYITFTDIFIDGIQIGSYSTDFVSGFTSVKSYLSLLSPAKSLNGTGVNITIENYQFIQNK